MHPSSLYTKIATALWLSLLSVNVCPASSDDEFEITVKALAGSSYTIKVKASDTVQTLKKKIVDTTQLSVEYQRLFFSGKRLEDGNPLGYYNITENCTVHLAGRPILIAVKKSEEEKWTIELSLLRTIGDLKNEIQEQKKIPLANQQLTFRDHVLDNDKTLLSYGIGKTEDSFTLHLTVKGDQPQDQDTPKNPSDKKNTETPSPNKGLYIGGALALMACIGLGLLMLTQKNKKKKAQDKNA